MDNLTQFAQNVGRDIKGLQDSIRELGALETDWVSINDYMRVKRIAGMVAIELIITQQTPVQPTAVGNIPAELATVIARMTFNPVVFADKENTGVLTRQVEIAAGGAVYIKGLAFSGSGSFYAQINFIV
ncbi:TPA: hypothetical protein VB881_000898 [Streptococcus suis]|nr:hypothetical protein [Streptococcus suis]